MGINIQHGYWVTRNEWPNFLRSTIFQPSQDFRLRFVAILGFRRNFGWRRCSAGALSRIGRIHEQMSVCVERVRCRRIAVYDRSNDEIRGCRRCPTDQRYLSLPVAVSHWLANGVVVPMLVVVCWRGRDWSIYVVVLRFVSIIERKKRI